MTTDLIRPQNGRLLALDIMRGITVAGMILVNNPGSWSYVYAPLRHAEWHGLTPTDLVFPFFVFILGASCYASLRKFDFRPSSEALLRIARRTVRIFAVGLLLGWFGLSLGNWTQFGGEGLAFCEHLRRSVTAIDHLRILGVLQRLALCYGAASLVGVFVRHKYIPWLIAAVLAGYYLLLLACNGFTAGAENMLCDLDRALWGENHMYLDQGVEPEGLLSTIPAVCQALVGFCFGRVLFDRNTDDRERVLKLLLGGAALTFAGLLLDYGCPINKKIWTPTFVSATCGLGASLLGLLIWIVDVKGVKKPFRFFEAFGVNPMPVYVFSGVVVSLLDFVTVRPDTSVKDAVYGLFCRWWGSYPASLAVALLLIGCCWAAAYPLYRKRIYIRL